MFKLQARTAGTEVTAQDLRSGDRFYRRGTVVTVEQSFTTARNDQRVATDDGMRINYPLDERFTLV